MCAQFTIKGKGLTGFFEVCRSEVVMSGLRKVKMSGFGENRGGIIDQKDIRIGLSKNGQAQGFSSLRIEGNYQQPAILVRPCPSN